MPFVAAPSDDMALALRPSSQRPADQHQPDADAGPDAGAEPALDIEDARAQMRSHEQERTRRLTAKNRRLRYLELHPDYFDDTSLELANPLLYDRLIRRFQSAAEREAEGRRKGFSGVMSTDIYRTEAKKDALRITDPMSLFSYTRGPQGQIVEEDKDEVPMTKEEGKDWWRDEMTQRFLRGDDEDFDYKIIDRSKYNPIEEERDIQDAYFDDAEPEFCSDGEGKDRVLTSETGIQDY